MHKECIQLPPLPADTDVKVVEMAWLFAKLEKNEQEMVHDLLKIWQAAPIWNDVNGK